MATVSPVSIVAGLMLSLTMPGAYAVDELPGDAVRVTSEELKWRPGRVPGHEIAPLMVAQPNPAPSSSESDSPQIAHLRLIHIRRQNLHHHFRHLVRGLRG